MYNNTIMYYCCSCTENLFHSHQPSGVRNKKVKKNWFHKHRTIPYMYTYISTVCFVYALLACTHTERPCPDLVAGTTLRGVTNSSPCIAPYRHSGRGIDRVFGINQVPRYLNCHHQSVFRVMKTIVYII